MEDPYYIAKLKESIPLVIEHASWENEELIVSGSNWSFAARSAWRVSSKKGFEYGAEAEPTQDQVRSLIGAKIIEASPSGIVPLDVVLHLNDGLAIECFSATHYEPWVLKLPDGTIMVADGSIG
ncbi:hypothetical protein SAMN04488073_2974 [Marinobacter gudaonensis]|uniref:Uncharacterized protein n=1 Tax=Marinobacter gudaonensis TaxID=375760 RepID=A0A1I6HSZ1_9GAMM|nr:hypothetical protein [Marinobacter gudaonensis]SFR57517.1 hypothetical protein SAMN04488073_2974 [Marinobacter gudaonensis]